MLELKLFFLLFAVNVHEGLQIPFHIKIWIQENISVKGSCYQNISSFYFNYIFDHTDTLRSCIRWNIFRTPSK